TSGQTWLSGGSDERGSGAATDAYLLESAFSFPRGHTVFGRIERADKNELFEPGSALADQVFQGGKLSLGYIYDFAATLHFKYSIGALVSKYSMPTALESSY